MPLSACAQNSTQSPALASVNQAAWEPVPPMNWTGIKPSDFADNELEVPYLLNHFATVANAVVEKGENRGFLDIKVNREPKDNAPYNARIQETNIALSYFYGAKRPWNPYYGSIPVKQRLEAMLEFWCKIQGPDGRFSEYKPGDYSLAPTGFGVRAMAQTLEILKSGGPTIDSAILERTMLAQRKAIMSLLTVEDSIRWGREYSNQFSGVYQAALSYMKLRPDAEMQKALEAATKRAVVEHESPAGFMYEWGGADFGYSNVHDNNLRLAWSYVKNSPVLYDLLVKESENWHRWLSYNLVAQPGTAFYLTNGGINTRTANAVQTPISRPMGEAVEMARAFSPSTVERKSQIASERAKLEANWPKFKPLVVPSAYSYNTGPLQTAYKDPDLWFPTPQQKAAAVAKLPYLARTEFVHQANDPRPYHFTYVRRPAYYAIFNSGVIRRENIQDYGLGLLWNPTLGTVMQSVGQTDWMWGTRPEGAKMVRETQNLNATLSLAGKPLNMKPGAFDYPVAPVKAVYDLPGGGQKTVQMEADRISVSVRCSGNFTEVLPLVKQTGDELKTEAGRLTLRRGNASFTVTFDPQARVEVQSAKGFQDNLEHVNVTLAARDQLSYSLAFNTPR